MCPNGYLRQALSLSRQPDEIAQKLEELREVGVGYVLINGGGSGGGVRGPQSQRRFAREVMPMFADEPPMLAIAGK
jgi:hypothetical protein